MKQSLLDDLLKHAQKKRRLALSDISGRRVCQRDGQGHEYKPACPAHSQ